MSNSRFLLYFPSIFSASIIFLLSSFSRPLVEINSFAYEDKLLHMLIFFIFGVCLLLPLSKKDNFNERKSLLIIFIIGVLYGAFDEFHQSFVPGRLCDIFDLLADSVGIAVAIFLRHPIIKLLIKR